MKITKQMIKKRINKFKGRLRDNWSVPKKKELMKWIDEDFGDLIN